MSEKIDEVAIGIGKDSLMGTLTYSEKSKGVVLFAHGSGSSRFSSRNRYVAKVLNEAGIATLLMDILTSHEEIIDQATGALRFDIDLLKDRVLAACHWLKRDIRTQKLPIGLFGASTGGAAALAAASELADSVKAVVSRGGRPDLAEQWLFKVRAPTLFLVGGDDSAVIGFHQKIMGKLDAPKELLIIPHAGHLFEEPGTLEQVAEHARDWFLRYFH